MYGPPQHDRLEVAARLDSKSANPRLPLEDRVEAVKLARWMRKIDAQYRGAEVLMGHLDHYMSHLQERRLMARARGYRGADLHGYVMLGIEPASPEPSQSSEPCHPSEISHSPASSQHAPATAE